MSSCSVRERQDCSSRPDKLMTATSGFQGLDPGIWDVAKTSPSSRGTSNNRCKQSRLLVGKESDTSPRICHWLSCPMTRSKANQTSSRYCPKGGGKCDSSLTSEKAVALGLTLNGHDWSGSILGGWLVLPGRPSTRKIEFLDR